MEIPEIRYATAPDGVRIAYQVIGNGVIDLLYVPGFVSNLRWNWELPSYASFLRELSSFSRLIIIDRRGSGLSDRLSPEDAPSLEVLADDIGVVLDEVEAKKVALFGAEGGGLTCSLFTATHPERVDRLILFAMDPGGEKGWGAWDREQWESYLERVAAGWGTRDFARWDLETVAPSLIDDPTTLDWYATLTQLAASPSSALALLHIDMETDVQAVLPSIRVPTLVLHRIGDRLEPIDESRFVARLIPGAELVELPGDDHAWMVGDVDAIVAGIRGFLTGERRAPELDRVLVTVLFTDIVGSTEMIGRLGDARWTDLLATHHERTRTQLERFRGREVDTTGDGFFATFDGPARAVRCAEAIQDAVRPLGLQIRAGVHTGEVELSGDDVGGIAVHVGARVAALAGPSEILVSGTVRDLVAGSGLSFEDAGEHELKGVPDRWHLFRVVS